MAETASGNARIWYQATGEGDPVLFIHAGICDSRMWDPQFAGRPESHRYIRYDQQGFGRTPLAGDPYTGHEDALAVLDGAGAGSAVVVGCSMGGGTAIDLALAAPDRIRGLVLIGAWSPGFTGPDAEYEPAQWPEVVASFRAGDLDRAAELETEIWVVGVGRARSEVDADLLETVKAMDRQALETEKQREELSRPLDPPAAERMGELIAPVLVMVGEHDLPDIRAAAAHLAAGTGTGAPVVIPGTAHLPNLERPEVFDAALRGFLETTR